LEDGIQDDILWDVSESSCEDASATEYDGESEEAFEERFDGVRKQEERLLYLQFQIFCIFYIKYIINIFNLLINSFKTYLFLSNYHPNPPPENSFL
jgi:hypothetical protein